MGDNITLGSADPDAQTEKESAKPHGGSVDTTDVSVSVSTTFHPTAGLGRDDEAPDLLMLTSDSVFFYLHSSVLLHASDNRFGHLVPSVPRTDGQSATAIAKHSSNTINLILHAVYKLPCLQFSHSFDEVSLAICTLPHYGVTVKECVQPGSSLFQAAMAHAPFVPLEVYALAANFDLFELAVATSSHLLSVPLHAVTDDIAGRIGPLYLKKLIILHLNRAEKLKELILTVPSPHLPTDTCEGQALGRVWGLASAPIAWETRPDISTSMIKSVLAKGEDQLSCSLCRQHLHSHIDYLIEMWMQEKRTIS